MHGDRQNYAAFEAQMQELGTFDCVIDMVGYVPEDAQSVVRAFRGRIGHFIFCSPVDVYYKPAASYPYREETPYGGLNSYSINKVACEKTLLAAHQHGDFPVTIIRPAYTYGDGSGVLYPFGTGSTYIDRIRAAVYMASMTALHAGSPTERLPRHPQHPGTVQTRAESQPAGLSGGCCRPRPRHDCS